jgi:hypothetical protein
VDIALTPEMMFQPMSRDCSGDIFCKIESCERALEQNISQILKNKWQKQITILEQSTEYTLAHIFIFDYAKKGSYPTIEFLLEYG